MGATTELTAQPVRQAGVLGQHVSQLLGGCARVRQCEQQSGATVSAEVTIEAGVERAAVSSMIDSDHPSNVGTAIVEWDGWPQFWQRDRIIFLYLGRDETTIRAADGAHG